MINDLSSLRRDKSVVYVIQRYSADHQKWLDWSTVYREIVDLPAMETQLAHLRATFLADTWRPVRRETSVWESLIE